MSINVYTKNKTDELLNNKADTTSVTTLTEQINSLNTNKQNTLVSGTNIKTVNGTSILGSGDITISSATIDTSDFAIKTGSNTFTGNQTFNGKVIINGSTEANGTIISGSISTSGNITGNTITGNTITAESSITSIDIDATGHIYGGSIAATTGNLTAKGNITTQGNITASGSLTATSITNRGDLNNSSGAINMSGQRLYLYGNRNSSVGSTYLTGNSSGTLFVNGNQVYTAFKSLTAYNSGYYKTITGTGSLAIKLEKRASTTNGALSASSKDDTIHYTSPRTITCPSGRLMIVTLWAHESKQQGCIYVSASPITPTYSDTLFDKNINLIACVEGQRGYWTGSILSTCFAIADNQTVYIYYRNIDYDIHYSYVDIDLSIE